MLIHKAYQTFISWFDKAHHVQYFLKKQQGHPELVEG